MQLFAYVNKKTSKYIVHENPVSRLRYTGVSEKTERETYIIVCTQRTNGSRNFNISEFSVTRKEYIPLSLFLHMKWDIFLRVRYFIPPIFKGLSYFFRVFFFLSPSHLLFKINFGIIYHLYVGNGKLHVAQGSVVKSEVDN